MKCLLDVDPLDDRNLIPPIVNPPTDISLFAGHLSTNSENEGDELLVKAEEIEEIVSSALLSNTSTTTPVPHPGQTAKSAETVKRDSLISPSAHPLDDSGEFERPSSTEGIIDIYLLRNSKANTQFCN